VCRSVLQCAAVCCSALQCVAVCCSVWQYNAVCCSVLQRVVERYDSYNTRATSHLLTSKKKIHFIREQIRQKEAYTSKRGKYVKKSVYVYMPQKSFYMGHKKHVHASNKDQYTYVKRDPYIRPKIPINMNTISRVLSCSDMRNPSKETHVYVQRDLYISQTRSTYKSKETYIYEHELDVVACVAVCCSVLQHFGSGTTRQKRPMNMRGKRSANSFHTFHIHRTMYMKEMRSSQEN